MMKSDIPSKHNRIFSAKNEKSQAIQILFNPLNATGANMQQFPKLSDKYGIERVKQLVIKKVTGTIFLKVTIEPTMCIN